MTTGRPQQSSGLLAPRAVLISIQMRAGQLRLGRVGWRVEPLGASISLIPKSPAHHPLGPTAGVQGCGPAEMSTRSGPPHPQY